jgi:hypothetical protein
VLGEFFIMKNKFKVGDKVKFVRYNDPHGVSITNGFQFPLGTIFTISRIYDYNKDRHHDCGEFLVAETKESNAWYIPLECFESKRDPPKTEVEWLDRVQENFKD